jgi:heme exporter protein A
VITPTARLAEKSAGDVAIAVRGIRVAFGATIVLRGIDLTVPWGARLALLGPNGAGKSSLLRILATLARPTAGSVRIAEQDALAAPLAVRRAIGVVAHQTYLYDELTARENLRFYGALYDLPALDARIAELLDRVGLTAQRNARAATLSRGQQQRLTIARALLHDPPILLLDEPDTGLDLAAFGLLEGLLRAEERTVLLTTHNLRQATRLCDRYAILNGGRLVTSAPLTRGDDATLEERYRQATAAIPRSAVTEPPREGATHADERPPGDRAAQ